MFADRTEAGSRLAKALQSYAGRRPLVLGLPRGGVVVAAEVARALGGDLDVMFVKKLGAPGNPELGIGAIGEDGRRFLNERVAQMTGADDDYVARLAAKRLAEIGNQARQYRAVRAKASPTGRVCILVDDGLATGATMIAAIQATAAAKPALIVVAVPGGPDDAIEQIKAMPEVSDVVCLETPAWFSGVSQLYDDFRQVEDVEVLALLKEFAGRA
ncbi:MAG: phosphoribosyltransferase family protein [Verrucomicrobiae bacterium]|nr:phosphoribosyltransferase family protein [Verrucomicrobiae bacterium]